MACCLGVAVVVGPVFADDPNYNKPAQAASQKDTVTTPGAEITMKFYQFAPKEATVVVGTTATWVNEDGRDHNIRFAAHQGFGDKAPVSPTLRKGVSWSYTFKKAGVYEYSSDSRPSMKATIRVIEAGKPLVIEQREFAFKPAQVKATPGTVVIFENEDPTQHNVRVKVNPNNSREVASPYLSKGEKWSYLVISEGTYRVLCDPHSFMEAEITVVSDSRKK